MSILNAANRLLNTFTDRNAARGDDGFDSELHVLFQNEVRCLAEEYDLVSLPHRGDRVTYRSSAEEAWEPYVSLG
jgi:hypothetical protein